MMEDTWPCFQEVKIVYHLYKQLVNFLLTGKKEKFCLQQKSFWKVLWLDFVMKLVILIYFFNNH